MFNNRDRLSIFLEHQKRKAELASIKNSLNEIGGVMTTVDYSELLWRKADIIGQEIALDDKYRRDIEALDNKERIERDSNLISQSIDKEMETSEPKIYAYQAIKELLPDLLKKYSDKGIPMKQNSQGISSHDTGRIAKDMQKLMCEKYTMLSIRGKSEKRPTSGIKIETIRSELKDLGLKNMLEGIKKH